MGRSGLRRSQTAVSVGGERGEGRVERGSGELEGGGRGGIGGIGLRQLSGRCAQEASLRARGRTGKDELDGDPYMWLLRFPMPMTS